MKTDSNEDVAEALFLIHENMRAEFFTALRIQ
jgi:hypothetical protein